MLDALRDFLSQKVAPAVESRSEGERDQALRLAAAALVFEVVRADGEVLDSERTVMRAALQSAFGLTEPEVEELSRLAEQQSRQAISLYELTEQLDRELSAEAKKRIVELLWLVAFADGRKDAHEEHVVRTVATLLHVSHPDFIDAKIRARERSGAGQPEPEGS